MQGLFTASKDILFAELGEAIPICGAGPQGSDS